MASTLEFDTWESPHTKSGASRDIAEIMPKAIAAWDQNGTVAVLDRSLNVTSYTDVAAGDWNVNFSFTWSIANYCYFVTCMADVAASSIPAANVGVPIDETWTTTAIAFQTGFCRNTGGGTFDSPEYMGWFIGE